VSAPRIYADHNATSPLLEALRPRVAALFDTPLANPSSLHADGRAARAAIDRARESVAALCGVQPAQIVFTATATEANALALNVEVQTIASSAIEHPSVLETLKRRSNVTFVPASRDGLTQPFPRADLSVLVWANNETGVVQPIASLAGRKHVDAVQALGKLDIVMGGADTYAISAHKLGGLPGAAALVITGEAPKALWRGGGHEHGLRGGTENLHAIVAFGWAAELWREQGATFRANMRAARDAFEAALHGFDHAVIGAQNERLPNTSNVLVPGLRGEALLSALDLAGVAVSHGSACATGSLEPSHVLLACGFSEDEARTALRVSFGPMSSAEEGREVATRLLTCAARLRSAR
jgi:cysteine desulfurase